MLVIPTKPIADGNAFTFTVFRRREHTTAWFVGDTFADYVEIHEKKWLKESLPKAERPCIVHGATRENRKTKDAIQTCTALVLDYDKHQGALDTARLGGIRYFYQERLDADTGILKWHLVLPLAEPITDPAELESKKLIGVQWFAQHLGYELDGSLARVTQILHPYMSDARDTRWSMSERCLDLEAIVEDVGYRPPARPRGGAGTPQQETAYKTAFEKAIGEAGLWLGDWTVKGRPMRCPLEEEHSEEHHAGDSSCMFMSYGRIVCHHSHGALYSNQIAYARALGVDVNGGDFPPDAQLLLELGTVERVSVIEAGLHIERVLREARPYDNTASVVRVSTGAGKTHAVSSFLNQYSAPVFDEETGDLLPGRSAVLAMPTNALLREVEGRLTTDHRVRVGVLAVLNDDGTPACKKHTIASALQAKGGDVHRLMCAKCEHRESCPARERSRSGSGDLTVTNHSLLPSVVRDLRESGRVPLIVWDESPAMVESVTLKFSDLEWLLAKFEEEDRPRRVTIEDLTRATVFSDRYRLCLRPLIEVLRRVRGQSLVEATEEYGRTRMASVQLASAEALLGYGSEGAPLWTRITRAASEARRLHVSEWMFDEMRTEDQDTVLRAESVRALLDAAVDPMSIVKSEARYLEITRVTEAGAVWRACGGVVLDATAPVAVLKALRKDVSVVDLHVEDADQDIGRTVKVVGSLSRRYAGFTEGRKALSRVLWDLQREKRGWDAVLGRPARVVVFVYKTLVDDVRVALGEGYDVWYYGNTRGYNRWFEEGYDAFVTIGDPFSNLGVDRAVTEYLRLTGEDEEAYSTENARAELAQAHGRARDPQVKRAAGGRWHIHYGRWPPLGWDVTNTDCVTLGWERAGVE